MKLKHCFKILGGIAYVGVRIACLFLPRRLRRRLRNWYKRHFTVDIPEWVREIWIKHVGLKQCWKRVELLALGSSHGAYGFIPGDNEFNLCSGSQDLYTSHELYLRCSGLPRLKKIVQFYSVFSPGFELERTTESERCVYYRKIWGIPYRYHDEQTFLCNEKVCKNLMRGGVIGSSYRGECINRVFFGEDAPAEARAGSHLKNNRRGNGQTEWLGRMIETANAAGHKMVVAIPPARSDYMKFMPGFEELFGELLALLKEHPEVKLVSFWGDPAFADGDFGDTDHLNEHGARKLTKMLKGDLAGGVCK